MPTTLQEEVSVATASMGVEGEEARCGSPEGEGQSQAESLWMEGGTGLGCKCVLCGPDLAKRKDPMDPSPRMGYLTWDEYFMALAFLSAQRSKDPNKQVGACIVDRDNIILGIGYNGFPRGCDDSDLPWSKEAESGNPLETKFPYVCHAEMNAILNSNSTNLRGSRMYVTMFPCNECAKLIVQSGISEVIYYEAKISNVVPNSPAKGPAQQKKKDLLFLAAQKLCHLAGVKLTQFCPAGKSVSINITL
ncbi:deoxycytidylate deaminase [Chloropicon primus]|uniref:dCMP deaminase n=2 Tax=Chloropicon primus TaxID=1764295 RepID=A0A5B8MR13_9CHLO|nr:deoxycytidylate deaminase [Chloropicon primus]UPR02371.1 deoxycytidylate deaminase [Chloropicon primus]|eukprot:QDZ23158.1 deoxycytidylate deaminase [Chloropicon primus]